MKGTTKSTTTDVVTRRLTMIVRDIVNAEGPQTHDDLVELVKVRCARLRLAWTRDRIDHAIAIVSSYRSVLVAAPRAIRTADNPPESSPLFSRDGAASILQKFGIKVRGMR